MKGLLVKDFLLMIKSKKVILFMLFIGIIGGINDISFATGDPALTGEVTGALSLIPLFYQKRVHVYPDFTSDEFYIRGNLMVKGHMALFHLLRSGIHILRDKNIKRLWYKIRK